MEQRRDGSASTRAVCRVPRPAAASLLGVTVALMALTGCSSGGTTPIATSSPTSAASSGASSTSASSSGASPTSSTSSGTPTVMPGRTLRVTVTGSTVNPPPAQVDLAVGEQLTLVVTSDHADELHAHGFDVEVPLAARIPTMLVLTGKQTGLFAVETHEPALTLLTVAVR